MSQINRLLGTRMNACYAFEPLLLALMLLCFAKRADSLVESTIESVVHEKLSKLPTCVSVLMST